MFLVITTQGHSLISTCFVRQMWQPYPEFYQCIVYTCIANEGQLRRIRLSFFLDEGEMSGFVRLPSDILSTIAVFNFLISVYTCIFLVIINMKKRKNTAGPESNWYNKSLSWYRHLAIIRSFTPDTNNDNYKLHELYIHIYIHRDNKTGNQSITFTF